MRLHSTFCALFAVPPAQKTITDGYTPQRSIWPVFAMLGVMVKLSCLTALFALAF